MKKDFSRRARLARRLLATALVPLLLAPAAASTAVRECRTSRCAVPVVWPVPTGASVGISAV